MAIVLKWGSYTFPLTPRITVRRDPAAEFPAPRVWRKTWELAGELYANTATAIKSLRDQLDALARADTVASLQLIELPTTVIDSLLAENSVDGLSVSAYEVPPSDGTEYATHVPFRVAVSGLYRFDYVDAILPVFGYQRVWGEWSITESIDANNQARTSVAGVLRGAPGVLNSALEEIIESFTTGIGGDRRLVSRRATRYQEKSTGTVTNRNTRLEFALEFAGTELGTNDVYEFQETIDYQPQTLLTIIKPVIGGLPPVQQLGAVTPPIVTQSGQAMGRSGYPDAPSPIYASHVEPAYVGKIGPVRGPDGTITGFGRRWRYTMVVPVIPPLDAPNPNVQPG